MKFWFEAVSQSALQGGPKPGAPQGARAEPRIEKACRGVAVCFSSRSSGLPPPWAAENRKQKKKKKAIQMSSVLFGVPVACVLARVTACVGAGLPGEYEYEYEEETVSDSAESDRAKKAAETE